MSNIVSSRRPNRLRYLLIAEAALLILTPAFPSRESPILSVIPLGIASGQAALLALWWALGPEPSKRRSQLLMLGVAAIYAVLLVRPDFGAWLMLLIAMRIVVVGGVFKRLRHTRDLMLSERDEHSGLAPFQLRVMHLLAIMFAVALFFALGRVQDRGGNTVVLFTLIALWGAGMAAVPLLAAMAAFARRCEWAPACVLTMLLIAIAAANAGFAFSQASPRFAWNTALRHFTWLMAEAAVVAGSVIVLRAMGYHLTIQPDFESARADAPMG